MYQAGQLIGVAEGQSVALGEIRRLGDQLIAQGHLHRRHQRLVGQDFSFPELHRQRLSVHLQ